MAEFKHYGIPGMHWGIRRRTQSSDHSTAREIQKKHVSEMSNEELRKLTTRMQLEKQYKDLSKRDVSFGEKFVKDVVTDVGKQTAKNFIMSEGPKVFLLAKNDISSAVSLLRSKHHIT